MFVNSSPIAMNSEKVHLAVNLIRLIGDCLLCAILDQNKTLCTPKFLLSTAKSRKKEQDWKSRFKIK